MQLSGKIITPVAALALAFAISQPSSAFDCTKAATKVEKLICSNQELKTIDEDMAKAYFALRKKLDKTGRKNLIRMQRAWLKRRDLQNDEDTILELYLQHTKLLQDAPTAMIPFYINFPASNRIIGGSQAGHRFANPKSPLQKKYNRQLKKQLRKFSPHTKIASPPNDTCGSGSQTEVEVTRNDKFILSATIINKWIAACSAPAHFIVHINIDKKTGRKLKMTALFGKKSLLKLQDDCADQIIDFTGIQYDGETPGQMRKDFFKENRSKVSKAVASSSRWSFGKTVVSVDFNGGAFTKGNFSCEFDVSDLTKLARNPAFFARAR